MATRVTIRTSTTEEFFDRLRDRARKLDKGELPRPGITITFEDPAEMLQVLTAERVRLLHMVKEGPQRVSALATELHRHVRAVSRDVSLLERAGLLRTRYETNPGHGRLKVVEPVAREYRLVTSL
jgi:predicted transcriptional regulator